MTRRHGFTLIELLIAVALMSIVMLFAMGAFNLQNQTYVVVDQVSETQQNTTAIARLIERDIRNAGYLMPPAAASCGLDSVNSPDILYLGDSDAVLPADQLPVTEVAEEMVASSSAGPTSTGSVVITVDDLVLDGTATYDTDSDGTPDSDFQIGGGAIITDLNNPDRGVACGLITAVDIAAPQNVTVDVVAALAGGGGPAQLVVVPAHVYRIDANTPPRLWRDGTPLARDVEDLQVTWFYDDDGDDVVDGGEVRGVSGNNYDSSGIDGNDLREIRFNVVSATRTDDPRNPTGAGTGQVLENRTAGSVAADDGKRRRVHTATVRLRNLNL